MTYRIFWISILAVTLLAVGGAAHAADEDPMPWYGLIACPITWPGSDDLMARLIDTQPFVEDLQFSPEILNDGGIEYAHNMALDCVYAGEHHLTLLIPGTTMKCNPFTLPKEKSPLTFACVTEPETDEGLGPVIYYLAEPITLKTKLQGFGLRWGVDGILAAAKNGGYQAESVTSMDSGRARVTEVRMTKDEEHLDVYFSPSTGLSRQVRWHPEKGDGGDDVIYRSLALRFGAKYVQEDTVNAGRNKRWTSVRDPVVFDFLHPYFTGKKGYTWLLTDTAAP